MFRIKIMKALFTGICLTFLISGTVLAGTGGGEPSRLPANSTDSKYTVTDTGETPGAQSRIDANELQKREIEAQRSIEPAAPPDQSGGSEPFLPVKSIGPDTPVLDGNASRNYPPESDDPMVLKQREIDRYLFEEHRAEIEQQGFTATHTAPADGYVEIGITPYNEANADYLYEIFGRDEVKIVEGQQAVLLSTTTEPADGAEIDVVSTTAENTDDLAEGGSAVSLPLLYSLGTLIVLGGAIVVTRKLKPAGK